MSEKVDWLASIDRIMIELQNFPFKLQRMLPQPKSPEQERKYENNGDYIYLNSVTKK